MCCWRGLVIFDVGSSNKGLFGIVPVFDVEFLVSLRLNDGFRDEYTLDEPEKNRVKDFKVNNINQQIKL